LSLEHASLQARGDSDAPDLRSDHLRLVPWHAELTGEHVDEIDVVPAFNCCCGHVAVRAEPMRRDDPRLLVEGNLDEPARCVESLPHDPPTRALVINVTSAASAASLSFF
jgi:hypothetical protein